MKEGKPITASLQHLIFYPSMKKSTYPTIAALHGRGTDANDLLPLIQSLALEDVLVIAPRAPLQINLGLGQGYAWYDLGEEEGPRPQTFRRSLELLRRFLAEIKAAYPVDPERFVLLGFSQGTVMAYAAGLTDPILVRAIVALSGYIPCRLDLSPEPGKLSRLRVFISHGTFDEIIPVQLGREAVELLKEAKADVVYREYPMGHEVREETLRDLEVWIKQLLS